jgi:5-hydroxyisourate hydrolase
VSTIIKNLVDILAPALQHVPTFEEEHAMGRLTTHVLDTARGEPAAGVAVAVFRVDGTRLQVAATTTNADGRCDKPLLEGADFRAGVYEIVFEAGTYFARMQSQLPEPPFVGDVVLRFGVADPCAHYHVPLLVSPWSYSTYRGS